VISSFALQYSGVSFQQVSDSGLDLFITEGRPFDGAGAISDEQVATLRSQGRIVLGYVNVAVTDDSRYYWLGEWTSNAHDTGSPTSDAPLWLKQGTALDFTGDGVQDALIVDFAQSEWRKIVVDQAVELMRQGYSGVFLDDVASYDLTYNDAQRQDPAIRAIIDKNALEMAKLVAAVAAAIGPSAQVYVNVDPYMTNYIPATAEGALAKQAYLAAVDGYLFENPTPGYLDDGRTNLGPDAPFLILTSQPGISDADAWARGTLYRAPGPAYNQFGAWMPPSGPGDDVMTGGDGPNILDGKEGNDRIDGGSGNDRLTGASGADLLTAGPGSDILSGGDGNDILFFGSWLDPSDSAHGGAGTDTLVLQGQYGGLVLGAASLTAIEGISLQSGSITRWGGSGADRYDYALTSADANVAAGQQLRINAQSLLAGEDFAFNGSAETNGAFLVYGGFGADTLTGGAGNDIFFFEAGSFGAGDRVAGGGGSDAVVISGAPAGSSGPVQVTIGAGALTSVESLSFNGRFASDPAARPSYSAVLQDGNIAPGATLIVNASSLEAGQSLSFDGGAAGGGKLRMFGGAGGDTLKGGAGDDVIEGGGGGDALAGGTGKDVFVYRGVADSAGVACDVISGFHFANDKIDLALVDSNILAAGDQAFAWIGTAAFSGVAGQLRAAWDAGMSLWAIQGDVNGDGGVDFQLYVATGAGPPPEADFIL
jgi:uncharacterized protein (TIGR01370 family)